LFGESMTSNRSVLKVGVFCLLWFLEMRVQAADIRKSAEREIAISSLQDQPMVLRAGEFSGSQFTWWLPRGAEGFVLPIAAGIAVETSNANLMRWLREGSPWSLMELPLVGARYTNGMIGIIVPYPHYAELIVGDRLGVRFSFPKERPNIFSADVVAVRCGSDPLQLARSFREWRERADDVGSIPRRKTLRQKSAENPRAEWLYGAPHIYLWGSALFSRHDIERSKWVSFAQFLLRVEEGSIGAKEGQPVDFLTSEVAGGMERALVDRRLLRSETEQFGRVLSEIQRENREAVGTAFREFVHKPASWGDGISIPMLESLREAGIDRALLVLSDLYGRSPRPDVAARAAELGYLFGPYDSYHSVHSPDADSDRTWETAQFDEPAFTRGRVLNEDGRGQGGFKGVGFHFSPEAAWPYVEKRVQGLRREAPYSTWFVDCDATGECFDDYNPLHPATRLKDIAERRKRLAWLGDTEKLVVGSEGGSVLFADLVHFGHGVQTPYIGHLDPEFRDAKSPYFLGRHFPGDSPQNFFKAVPAPPQIATQYFNPSIRIPLYRAAVGDEIIATHHWSFDSLKFSDVETTRELLDILYMVPPMYHLNRATWPARKERIVRHVAYWGPIHRQLAGAPLKRFEWLSEDRMLQRTTYSLNAREVTIIVNFGGTEQNGVPPKSAMVSGGIELAQPRFLGGSRN
jgi:hypothetical protein